MDSESEAKQKTGHGKAPHTALLESPARGCSRRLTHPSLEELGAAFSRRQDSSTPSDPRSPELTPPRPYPSQGLRGREAEGYRSAH